MFRNIQIYLLLLLSLVAASCSDSIDVPGTTLVPGSPGTLTIRFQNSTITRNAASDNSETLIQNVVVGLYPENASDEVEASKFIILDGVNTYSRHEFTVSLDDALVRDLFNNTGGNTCRIFAVANLPAGTFSDSDKPTVKQLKSVPIEADFYMTDVQLSFVMAGGGTVTYTAPAAGERIGSASGAANLLRAAAKIRLNVALPDTIHVGQTSPTDTDFEIWKPVPKNGLYALLNCGVQKAVSAPESVLDTSGETPVLIPWKPEDTSAYYNSTLLDGSWRELKKTGTGDYPYIMNVPFYTFPNAWVESPEEDYKTTLTFTVAWQREGELSWQTFFYQIPITPADMPQIVRNHSYTINLKVGMLGALTQEEPVLLDELTYQIVDWGSQDVDVDIQDFRYLVVDPNDISLDNEDEITIPFYSSHPVDANNLTMTFQRFNYYSNGNGDVVKIEVPQNIINNSTWTHSIEENGVTKTVTDTMVSVHIVRDPASNQYSLNFKHSLASMWVPYNNNTQVALTGQGGSGEQTITASSRGITKFVRPETADPPFSSYTITLRLQHQDNSTYYEDITITQYPGMYIQAYKNPGDGTGSEQKFKGNVFINNYNPASQTSGVWGVSSTEWGKGNSNPVMYVVSTTQLNSSSEFIIGDPRTEYTLNDLDGEDNLTIPTKDATQTAGNWCQTATALYKEAINGTTPNTRRLSYYYPTIESTEEQYMMRIAPKFRIASSYGRCQSLPRENARRRIATYQELNCPAGRWRLPTYGELKYIVSLSQKGIIPTLFEASSSESAGNYWTAQGPYHVNRDGSLTLSTYKYDGKLYAFVRGVYDEWYWERYTNYTITPTGTNYSYRLGDVPRSAPIPTK